MKKPYPSIRVFQNPYLEKLTHVHPIIPLVLWAPIISFLFYRSLTTLGFSVSAVAGLTAFGLGSWTISEYVLHRFVFHFKPHGPFQERLQFLMHGLHHDDPKDPTRLVMPPAGSLILGVILFTIFRTIFLIFGAPEAAEPFFAAFVVGYLCYDYIHYGVHHFNPKSKLGKKIKHNHMLHHFVAPDASWGVSSPFWDHVFGTVAPAASAKPKRAHAPAPARENSSDRWTSSSNEQTV